MADKIRLGFVGANVRSTWAAQSHFPALLASPDVELTAVCTTRPESAEEARRTFGAQLAFHDYRAMVASPAIDAVAVVVKVPEHYGPTKAAIEAGKHVYTEWPLGRTTAEAEELTALAQAEGVQTVVGLQSRVSPTLLYIRELLETGYVGEMLSCHVTAMRHVDLAAPAVFVYVPAAFPRGDPFNVGKMYALFAEAIHTGQSRIPTFDTAVELHRFIDTIQQASDTGRELPVA